MPAAEGRTVPQTGGRAQRDASHLGECRSLLGLEGRAVGEAGRPPEGAVVVSRTLSFWCGGGKSREGL